MRAHVRRLIPALALACAGAAALAETEAPVDIVEARTQLSAADRDLNDLYQRCTAPEAATVQSIAALREAQRKWLEVRDLTARAYQLNESSREPKDDEHYIHAQAVMTWSRAEELKSLFGCE